MKYSQHFVYISPLYNSNCLLQYHNSVLYTFPDGRNNILNLFRQSPPPAHIPCRQAKSGTPLISLDVSGDLATPQKITFFMNRQTLGYLRFSHVIQIVTRKTIQNSIVVLFFNNKEFHFNLELTLNFVLHMHFTFITHVTFLIVFHSKEKNHCAHLGHSIVLSF